MSGPIKTGMGLPSLLARPTSQQLIDACATISTSFNQQNQEASSAPRSPDNLSWDDVFTTTPPTSKHQVPTSVSKGDNKGHLPIGTLSPEKLLVHTTHFLDCRIQSVHDTAVSQLRRIAKQHIRKPGPLTIAAFDVATWLFQYSDVNRHIGNRSVAAEVIACCGPHLPALYGKALEVARELRPAILEQHNDVENLMEAYRSLIHLFPEGNPEVTEGVVIFIGLVDNAKRDNIQVLAQGVLASLVDQFPYLTGSSHIIKHLPSVREDQRAPSVAGKGRAG